MSKLYLRQPVKEFLHGFQNVYLFEDTIENNIKFGQPDATHEQVVEAAKEGLLPRVHLCVAGWLRYKK